MSPEDKDSGTTGNRSAGLDEQLAALPVHDLDHHRSAHLRRQAAASFAGGHRRAATLPGASFLALYSRVLEPAWVAALCIAYLGWALITAASLQG